MPSPPPALIPTGDPFLSLWIRFLNSLSLRFDLGALQCSVRGQMVRVNRERDYPVDKG